MSDTSMDIEIAIAQLKHASKNPGTLLSVECMKAILREIEWLQETVDDYFRQLHNERKHNDRWE